MDQARRGGRMVKWSYMGQARGVGGRCGLRRGGGVDSWSNAHMGQARGWEEGVD